MENKDVQTFVFEKLKPEVGKRILFITKISLGAFIVFVIIVLNFKLPSYIMPFGLVLLPLPVILMLVLSVIKNNRIKEVFELYNDHIVISGIDADEIKFSAIKSYRLGKGRFKWAFLLINLEDGRERIVNTGYNDGLKPFFIAFQTNIKAWASINNLPPKEEETG